MLNSGFLLLVSFSIGVRANIFDCYPELRAKLEDRPKTQNKGEGRQEDLYGGYGGGHGGGHNNGNHGGHPGYPGGHQEASCPTGWESYKRKGNRIWCYKVNKIRTVWEKAQLLCQAEGASLSGFESDEEYVALQAYLLKNLGKSQVFLGAKRRAVCNTKPEDDPYNENAASPCSKENLFEWVNGVSNNNLVISRHWDPINPSNKKHHEYCLTIMNYGYVNNNMINDIDCAPRKLPFVCGKFAKAI
ncbi:unnamed protein product [Caenorhabditis auriculariae]|uniref:C-type lectin domain-containing protein n=1 Tax=Caenorhabditis auriculariae TaxID=2777116 RepID=A0A8S1GXF9_9PELO|nr:unnamed protein product [Caenorhabditis auriculariae]